MLKFILLFSAGILIINPGEGFTQIKSNILLTDTDKQVIDAARVLHKNIRKYKRDSLVMAKRLLKEHGTNKSIQYKEELILKSDSLRKAYGIDKIDSEVDRVISNDLNVRAIADPALKEFTKEETYLQIKKRTDQLNASKSQMDGMRAMNIDSIGEVGKNWLDKLPEIAENEAAARIKEVGELQKQAKMFDKFKLGANQSSLINKGKSEGAEFAMQHASVISESVSKVKALKKKYSYVPNSKDLSSARKINSLEEEPFRKRIKRGGTLQIQRGSINSIDFSPTVAYRVNKLFSFGMGVTYRASFGFSKPPFNSYYYSNDAAGWRIYSEHFIKKPYFAHVEVEQLTHNLSEKFKAANTSFMAGLGREFRLSKKLKAVVQVLYNFSYNSIGDSDFYKSPWNFRFGLVR